MSFFLGGGEYPVWIDHMVQASPGFSYIKGAYTGDEPFISTPSSCTSVLDWDQGPRLSDLSCALKALGWIRP